MNFPPNNNNFQNQDDKEKFLIDEESQKEIYTPRENLPVSETKKSKWPIIALSIFLVLVVAGAVYFFADKLGWELPWSEPETGNTDLVAKFESEDDFKEYLAQAAALSESDYYGQFSRSSSFAPSGDLVLENIAAPQTTGELGLNVDLGLPAASQSVRYSETNVQVAGIDESDIVKNDGQKIYFASPQTYNNRVFIDWVGPGMPPDYNYSKKNISIINAFPPEQMSLANTIDKTSDDSFSKLLLYEDNLLVLNNEYVASYDVSDPSSTKENWKLELKDKNQLITARLYQDDLFLMTKNTINIDQPDCIIKPLSLNGQDLSISCLEIYHPRKIVPADSTYSVFKINIKTGEVQNTTSFLGSERSSATYMSANAIYLTYEYPGDIIAYLASFFEENPSLVSTTVIEKLSKLKDVDISLEAKMVEIQMILEKYTNSLNDDDRLKFENEMENRMADYALEHQRDLEKTGIVKISLESMKVIATGEVSGYLLNQFSLDEYDNYLRVATTFGDNWFIGSRNSASDVYTLDKNLKVKGSVQNLGTTERIYSVRFVGNQGYVVTFRQTDPFYVIDLKNQDSPQLAGELKIPGYSSYLHPLKENIILGIGKEGGDVKLSLFDVSDANNPLEKDKYLLDEYSSETLSNHNAFMADPQHEIFFIPGQKGGYIFSYKNDSLEMLKAVSAISPQRALYIDDYLYLVGLEQIVVFDENTLELINSINLDTSIDDKTFSVLEKEERDAKRISDIKQMQTALELFFNDCNNYPTQALAGLMTRSLTSSSCPGDIDFGDYIGTIPQDPLPGDMNYVYQSLDGKTYTLYFSLENGLSTFKSGHLLATPSGIEQASTNTTDSDGDGLTDYEESFIWSTNPSQIDTDGDGYNDGEEVKNGFSPTIPGGS